MAEAPTDFELTTESRNGARVVHVKGEVDISTHERLGERLVDEANSGGAVVVDLSACSFIDSSGIRALLLGHKAAQGANGAAFAIVASSPQVARVLELTGVDEAVKMYQSLDEALKSL